MAVVKFNSVEEFLEEVEKDRSNTHLKIVRLTNVWAAIPNLAPIRALSVVATAKVKEDIVRLDRYCGQIWNIGSQDEGTYKRAEAVRKQIEEAAKKLGIEIRAGVWEE